MSKAVIDKLNKYFQQKKDTGENGLWINPSGYSKEDKCSEDKCSCNNKIKELEKIKSEILKCRKCELGKYRLNPCFGNGDPDADIMFIGEGPGFDEDHSGIVFIGRAGKLLDRIIYEAFNLERSQVYIANIVKCHPMKRPEEPEQRGNDRPPTPGETETCLSYLTRQINIIKPKIIVTLGSPSTKTILKTDKGITGLRGKIYDVKFGNMDMKVVPTYHPAYLLRSPSKIADVKEDTKLISSLL